MRDYVFDVLFSELSAASSSLQLLISYAISLQCTAALECISKWVVHNIGNEVVVSIFERLVEDHFLLATSPASHSAIATIDQRSPMFASLFMTIVLDMLTNGSIRYQDSCLTSLFDVFDSWVILS